MQVTVIGLGHSFRHDDAVGLVLLRRLQARGVPAGVKLFRAGDPWRMVALGSLTGSRDAWVVVDAVRLGEEPGTLHRFADAGLLEMGFGACHAPLPASWLSAGGRPAQAVVLGVEPADLSYGTGLSPVVRHNVALLESSVRAAIAFFLRSDSI